MKKPYIKKFETISKFTLWIVDGSYIRKNIDEEFTNFGQHYRFKFIPENEFWIDKESQKGEECFYKTHMLVEFKLMSKGVSYEAALNKADKTERSERTKSKLFKSNIKLIKNCQKLINSIHKQRIYLFKSKFKLWIVKGEIIRDIFFIDFTEGGHDKVYNFIPKNEIWIDDDLNPHERKFILLHELHERNLMEKGMDYKNAHKSASEVEFYFRQHPDKLDDILKKELKK